MRLLVTFVCMKAVLRKIQYRHAEIGMRRRELNSTYNQLFVQKCRIS